MLYPKEDRASNTLMFACRTCQFSEPAASSCVFRNQLHNTVGETAGVTQDVGADPTVGDAFTSSQNALSCTCTMCGKVLACEECGEDLSMRNLPMLSQESAITSSASSQKVQQKSPPPTPVKANEEPAEPERPRHSLRRLPSFDHSVEWYEMDVDDDYDEELSQEAPNPSANP
jgi:DNA-directed RNA polymerase subunit M/transcription elongation factor TFIIS